jgi:hypothetical protein
VNSGLAAATIPPKFFNVGAQANFAINKDSSLKDLGDGGNYIFPLLYANLRISDIILFARGFGINQSSANFWYAGGGIGYILSDYKLLLPQIRILGAYHMLNASHSNQDIKISTATVNAIADFKLPVLPLHLLANIGYERNMMGVSWDADPNKNLGVNRVRASVGAQYTLFWVLSLSYEYTIRPSPNHNLGVSIGF